MNDQDDLLRDLRNTPGVMEMAGAYVYTTENPANHYLYCARCWGAEMRKLTEGWPPFWRCPGCGHVGVVIDLRDAPAADGPAGE